MDAVPGILLIDACGVCCGLFSWSMAAGLQDWHFQVASLHLHQAWTFRNSSSASQKFCIFLSKRSGRRMPPAERSALYSCTAVVCCCVLYSGTGIHIYIYFEVYTYTYILQAGSSWTTEFGSPAKSHAVFARAFFGSTPEDFGNRGELKKLTMRNKQRQKHKEKPNHGESNDCVLFFFTE